MLEIPILALWLYGATTVIGFLCGYFWRVNEQRRRAQREEEEYAKQAVMRLPVGHFWPTAIYTGKDVVQDIKVRIPHRAGRIE